MAAYKITENVWSVGVQNPNLRVFDIVMKTEYGTTYNAYYVKGDQKSALIETVHRRFFDAYLDNIQSVCDLRKVDYLILNHCEPDHSGSVGMLLERYPDITVVTSPGGTLNIKEITNNPDLKIMTVKEGDALDLGGKELHFTMAPFLHWPDTMFTYDPADRIVFTCDFLGAHYCEPLMLDTKISYPDAYESAFRGYYDAIMGPFASYVRAGLDKLDALTFDYVGTSHGPILTREGRYDDCVARYREWSRQAKNPAPVIPIFYCSAYGCTGAVADRLREGVLTALPDATAVCYDIIEHPMDMLAAQLSASDGFMIGSPTLNKDAVPPVWSLISHIDAVNARGKPCLAFGSYGWSGEAVPMLTARLRALGLAAHNDGYRYKFVASDADLAKATALGQEFAEALGSR